MVEMRTEVKTEAITAIIKAGSDGTKRNQAEKWAAFPWRHFLNRDRTLLDDLL